MKQFNSSVLSSYIIREKQCTFSRSCNFFSNSGYACTHVGGAYCGKYRALLQASKKEPNINRNLIQENFISN